MNTTTASKPSNNGTTQNTTAAAQAVNDAVKTNVEAGQKMFNTFTESFTKGFNNNGFNMNTLPFAPALTMPAMFEKMTKVMNGMVEANTKLVTEMGAITVESMKINARTMERTGEMLVGQMTGKVTTKPVTDMAREIMEETSAFNAKVAERVTKLNTEHGQRVAQIMEETMTCKTGTCCGGN